MSQRQYVATIENNNNNQAVALRHNQRNISIELGEARDVGYSTFVRSTYAARYNFGVKQYNSYETDSTQYKRNMRGGRFFLYNIIIFILFIASCVCTSYITNNKPLAAMPITTSVIYLLITCYNWHIHRINGSLIHDHMIKVANNSLPDTNNKHYTIPIHARIEDREIIAASDGSVTAILARLQQENLNLTEINIMLYTGRYKSRYISFPCETIFHFFLFIGILISAGFALIIIKN